MPTVGTKAATPSDWYPWANAACSSGPDATQTKFSFLQFWDVVTQRTGIKMIHLCRVEEPEEWVAAADTLGVDPRSGAFECVAGGDELIALGNIRTFRRSACAHRITGAARIEMVLRDDVVEAEERDRGAFLSAKDARRDALGEVREVVRGVEEFSSAGPGWALS